MKETKKLPLSPTPVIKKTKWNDQQPYPQREERNPHPILMYNAIIETNNWSPEHRKFNQKVHLKQHWLSRSQNEQPEWWRQNKQKEINTVLTRPSKWQPADQEPRKQLQPPRNQGKYYWKNRRNTNTHTRTPSAKWYDKPMNPMDTNIKTTNE